MMKLKRIIQMLSDGKSLNAICKDTHSKHYGYTQFKSNVQSCVEDRYEKKSVIIASQLPVDKWYVYIAEATLAEAIMDRLVNSSNLIKLEGPSMRQRRKR